MTPEWRQSSPRWNVRLSGVNHLIEIHLASGWWPQLPKAFSCDGVEYRLRYGWFRPRPRTVPFDVAGTPAVMTYWHRQPRFWRQMWRGLTKLLRDPRVWLAYILGGPGVGGGAVGGLATARALWMHELSVDGQRYGTWIADFDSGTLSWAFVPAGGALPDPNLPEVRGT
jgi:hypothetical protein